MWSCSDADGRDAQAVGNTGSEFRGDAFEHEGKAARLLEPVRVLQDLHSILNVPALHLEATHGMHALGCQTQMTHDRDLAFHESPDRLDALGTAFQLYGSRSALEKATGVAQGVVEAEVVAQIRHVGDNQSSRLGPSDGFEMMVHHRHADRQGVVEAQTHIADAVADQDHVHDRVGQTGCDGIIRRCHDKPLAATRSLQKHRYSDQRPVR